MKERFRNRVKQILGSGDKPGSGPGGYCICTKCGHENRHTRGVPCNERECPECGAKMTKK